MNRSGIRWGMIGCGDVTEVKSGPALYKVPDSSLVAVMRRDAAKAADYAKRHKVTRWYNKADALIHDAEVNAIYIATPPSTHEHYALEAIRAGKPVYVEKPVSVDAAGTRRILQAGREYNVPVSIAHYRRAWPKFQKVKSLIDEKAIGEVRIAKLDFMRRSLTHEDLQVPKTAWRVDPEISGGGLFHDLAPHQLDLMLYFFGEIENAKGYSLNQQQMYAADDIVSGNIIFKNQTLFTGNWCFNVDPSLQRDDCMIYGSHGSIRFSVFGDSNVYLVNEHGQQTLKFEDHQHVQQPMITEVVQYFLGNRDNPCGAEIGVKVMEIIDAFTEGG